MIFDNINNIERYKALDKKIYEALKFLRENKNNKSLENGKYEIIPEEVVAYVIEKDTIPEKDIKMEIHKEFMDIHFVLSGIEEIGISEENIDLNIYDSEYNKENDILFLDIQETQYLKVKEQEFYAVWPYELHKPLAASNFKSNKVKKIICKIKF